MLKQRVITALILFVLFMSALFFLPQAGWVVLVMVIVMQGAVEWSRLAKFSGNASQLYWWLTLVLMACFAWFDANHLLAQLMIPHLTLYGLSLLLWLIVVPLWMGLGWKVQNPWLMAAVGWGVLLPTGLALMDLREYSPWLLLGIMVLVWVADTAAYFSGRRFGKHKLAPTISPGKTWEGVIGALLAVTLYVLLVWLFSGYTQLYMYLPTFFIAAWCWVALAVEGDLFESLIKRQAGVKDSGALLPGHGGLLDRIDALTSTLPLAALLMLWPKLP